MQTVDGVGVAALGGPSSYPASGLLPDTTQGTTTCIFDARGRKASCTDRLHGQNLGTGGQKTSRIDYEYDANSNLISITDNDANGTNGSGSFTEYVYDTRNLLIEECFRGTVQHPQLAMMTTTSVFMRMMQPLA